MPSNHTVYEPLKIKACKILTAFVRTPHCIP